MEVSRAGLAAVAATIGQIPAQTLPEIVFAGKSNVGKSSLINVLVNRKALARTSSQPGKTRTINFYSVQEQWMFVGTDMRKPLVQSRSGFRQSSTII